MIRRIAAAGIDVIFAGLLAYLGFRAGDAAAMCKDMSNCPPLTPLVVFGAAVGIALYFGLGYLMWRRTPGQRLLDIDTGS